MQVARFWRTKKLRYRLVAMREGKTPGRQTSVAKLQDISLRDHLPVVRRVKVAS